MKRCSTCSRTYTDPNLSFCIEDGTPLTPMDPVDESTVVSPRGTGADEAAYRPPGGYVAPPVQARRRRVWPWVVGILGAFLLGIVAISIAAAILVPRWIRSGQNQRVVIRDPGNTNQAQNSNSVEPANSNTNANVNSNSNANVTIDVPPPADHDQVLAQLTDLENDWTLANINDDKAALERILADDYVGPTPDGGLQTKAEYIRTNRRDTRIEKWDFDDLKLNLIGDRATLSGKITYEIKDEDDLKFDFIDKFVWRDGRWQATGSVVKPRE